MSPTPAAHQVWSWPMATVTFTPNLQRHVQCESARAGGATVADVLNGVFTEVPRLRGYVLDERGRLRKHMVIFLDGTAVRDRETLFEEIPVPEYPPAPDGEAPWQDMHGRTVPDALQFIWCLEAGHVSQPGRLWCGTIPGGLFRSDDRGDSWQRVDSLWNDPLRRR